MFIVPEEGSGEGKAGLLFAPAERNVYSRAACANIPKPQRREAGKRDCFSLQRSVMSIAGRHVQISQSPRGANSRAALNKAPEGRHVYRQATCAL